MNAVRMGADGGIADQSGRVAIVTGAGGRGGIGHACAMALGAAGVKLVVGSTTNRIDQRANELADAGVDAVGFVGDLTDSAVADQLVESALARFGRVDILVNNAGMTAIDAPLVAAAAVELADDQWAGSLQRNLSSAFYVTRAALRPMVDSGYGRVVTVASASGPVSAFRGDAGYHAAKAGLVGLTRSVAIDVAGHGVTANAVAPGWIATDSSTPQELRMGTATPVGRPGYPHEVAALVAYLASPAAAYLTGQLLVLDGGNSIREEGAT